MIVKFLERDPEVLNLIKLFSEEAADELDPTNGMGTVMEPAESDVTKGTIRIDSLQ